MDNGMLQFRSLYTVTACAISYYTRALTEYVPAVDLLVVLLQIMVTFSKL